MMEASERIDNALQILAAGYAAMTADEAREREAADWRESLVGDFAEEPRL